MRRVLRRCAIARYGALAVACLLGGAGAALAQGTGVVPGFPVTVPNCGGTLRIAAPPKRMVVHDLNMVEMAMALGLQSSMVGVTGITGWYKADAAFLRDSQVPINMSAFGTTLTHAAWRSKPSWAVIATEDKAFDQAMLIHMAERIEARITKVSASHAVFMTQPKVVADTIDRAANQAGQPAR